MEFHLSLYGAARTVFTNCGSWFIDFYMGLSHGAVNWILSDKSGVGWSRAHGLAKSCLCCSFFLSQLPVGCIAFDVDGCLWQVVVLLIRCIFDMQG